MFSKWHYFFLAMVQGFSKYQTMLIFCLRVNDDFFNLSSFLMGDAYYIIKELLIESFGGRDVVHIIYCFDFTNNSVQRHIICLKWLAVCITKDKPSAIILFEELRMEGLGEKLLLERLIIKTQKLLISNCLIKDWQKIYIRKIL